MVNDSKLVLECVVVYFVEYYAWNNSNLTLCARGVTFLGLLWGHMWVLWYVCGIWWPFLSILNNPKLVFECAVVWLIRNLGSEWPPERWFLLYVHLSLFRAYRGQFLDFWLVCGIYLHLLIITSALEKVWSVFDVWLLQNRRPEPQNP